MSEPDTALVTGATGNVGLEVTKHLLAAGMPVRALAREPESGHRRILKAAASDTSLHVVGFDFVADTADAALFRRVRRLFLMRPPAIGDVKSYMFPFLEAAAKAGVEHIVLLSLMGAKMMPFVPHRKLEKEVMRLGFRYSFLRAGFFMQNLNTTFREFIRDHDELPIPAGGGKTSFVDTRDLGEAAARLILDRRGDSGAYELTGREALGYDEVARILSKELGRKTAYTRPNLRAFRRCVQAAGWEPEFARLVGRLFYTVRFGMAARVTGELREILGREPRSLREYVRDYREVWQRQSA